MLREISFGEKINASTFLFTNICTTILFYLGNFPLLQSVAYWLSVAFLINFAHVYELN